jgi:SAM-dependent methyltransferase
MHNKIKEMIKKNALGVEIGPSYNPILPKKEGYNVKVVDHCNTLELIEKYKAMGVDTAAIEDVDYIFEGSLSNIPLQERLDYIVASNVVEHVPDLIDFFVQCSNLLGPEGKLYLVVPDSRFCFDHFRQVSSISQVIECCGNTNTTVGKIADVVLNTSKRGEEIAWRQGADGPLNLVNSTEKALGDLKDFLWRLQTGYVDLHNWVFTPDSFRLLVNDLRLLGFTSLSEESFMDTEGFEFIVVLSVDDARSFVDRLEYLKREKKNVLLTNN